MGIPDIFVLIIGTYASGTPYHPGRMGETSVNLRAVRTPAAEAINGERLQRDRTHRHLRDPLRFLEHVLKDVKEVFSGHMLRHDAQGVDVRPGPVYAQAIRPEREYFTASSVGGGLGEPTLQRHCAHEVLDKRG